MLLERRGGFYPDSFPTPAMAEVLGRGLGDPAAVRGWASLACASLTRAHATERWGSATWDREFGEGGCYLVRAIEAYDFDLVNACAKGSLGRDMGMAGTAGATLLLHWGDLRRARHDWATSAAAWRKVGTRLRSGKSIGGWGGLTLDLVDARAARAVAMACGDWDAARALFACHVDGAAYEAVRGSSGGAVRGSSGGSAAPAPAAPAPASASPAGGGAYSKLLASRTGQPARRGSGAGRRDHDEGAAAAAAEEVEVPEMLQTHVSGWLGWMTTWKMECKLTAPTALLMVRATGALLASLPETRAAADAGELRWLPTPTRLLRLARAEQAWDVWLLGAQHPSLACALLFARLDRWAEAEEVANGLLDDGLLSVPLSRIEALRLLARCAERRGDASRADTALVQAAELAQRCGYVWLELVLAGEEYRRASHPPGGGKASVATKVEGSQRKRAARARVEELLRRVAAPADEAKAMLGIELEVE